MEHVTTHASSIHVAKLLSNAYLKYEHNVYKMKININTPPDVHQNMLMKVEYP